ncbi:MAG: PEFG-CTERM sorting domain-containing protein, partial [Thaumarchaeota archaeon]|nr:PEFG-CTERM sorting domain-containing protein [Nitrososphaerota archaeon]
TNSGILKNMCGGTFSSSGDFIGNPVDSISCTTTSKTSVVPEFPLALPVLVISMTSLIIFYRMKSAF